MIHDDDTRKDDHDRMCDEYDVMIHDDDERRKHDRRRM